MSYKKPNYLLPLVIALIIVFISFLVINRRDIKPNKSRLIADTLTIEEEQESIIFPNAELADSICGKQNRFTSKWCDIACD